MCPTSLRPQQRTAALFAMFDHLGGIASDAEMVEMLRGNQTQPISRLAKWIVNRDVLHFRWQSGIFIPRFQFEAAADDLHRYIPVAGIRSVLHELGDAMEDWELAEWFATPNVWLFAIEPAMVVAKDLAHVIQAARAARYISRGWC